MGNAYSGNVACSNGNSKALSCHDFIKPERRTCDEEFDQMKENFSKLELNDPILERKKDFI
jgi:hypothetical protein